MNSTFRNIRLNSFALLAIAAVLSAPAHAVNWPSAACPSTLQACINAAALGADIQIQNEAIIAEDLVLSRSVTLSKNGTAARLGPGRNIVINALGGTDTITVRNLWVYGQITATVGGTSGTARVNLDGLRVENTAGTAVFIERSSTVSAAAVVNLTNSTLIAGLSNPAVIVSHTGVNGDPTYNITNNDITAQGTGIEINLDVGRSNILANRIGRSRPSNSAARGIVVVSQSGGAGTAQIARNVVFNFAIGMDIGRVSGAVAATVVNNTIVRARIAGIRTQNATVTGRVANNLISSGFCGINKTSTGAPASTDYNFFHNLTANHCGGSIPGANDRTGTPEFISSLDFRVRSLSSPNVNAGNNADQPQFIVPLPDFDQRNGRVSSVVDAGAFEFGFDRSLEHASTAANSSGNLSTVSPPFVLVASDALQLSQFGRELDGFTPLPANASAHLGMWWSGPQGWTIFNQLNTAPLGLGRRFFTLLDLHSNTTTVHIANLANTFSNFTILDRPELNSRPNALPMVTQNYAPNGAIGIYNNSAIGLWYDTSDSRWKIFNQQPVGSAAPAMPINTAFNVMTPNELFANGSHAFRTAPLAVPVVVLNVDHPLLNNNSCAHPYVTSVFNPNNVYVPSNVVLSYNSNPDGRGNWAIERGDGLQIPANAAFHVYIDVQQSRRCNTELLSDGFE